MKTAKRSSAGFGVMEAMLFSGLATVVVLGTAAMVTRNSWQVKLLNVKSARDSLAASLRAQLADPALCGAGLINRSPLVLGTLPKAFDVAYTMIGSPDKVQTDFVSRDKAVTVKSFQIVDLKNAGITGSLGYPMQVGTMVIDLQSPEAGIGTTPLHPVELGQVYIETNGPTILNCFNNDGPFGAAAMACIQFGGINQNKNNGCDNSPFVTKIDDAIQSQVRAELDNIYTPFVMGQADGKILIETGKAYAKVTGDASYYTNTSKTNESNVIASGYTDANGRITSADAYRQNSVNNLWGQVNATTNTANQAASTASNARSTSNSANSVAQNANATATNADNQARNVWGTANLANSYANTSRDLANQATGYANSAMGNANAAVNTANYANGTGQGAYGAANYANSVASGAANTAQQANNYATSAYNTANWANSTSYNANNTANWANGTTASANGTSNWAYSTATQASSLAQGAYYRAPQINNTGYTAWDCSQMYGTACP